MSKEFCVGKIGSGDITGHVADSRKPPLNKEDAEALRNAFGDRSGDVAALPPSRKYMDCG